MKGTCERVKKVMELAMEMSKEETIGAEALRFIVSMVKVHQGRKRGWVE